MNQIRQGTKRTIEATGNEAHYVDLDVQNGNISENVHFDIKQIQFVVWTGAEDLKDELQEQIAKFGLTICMRI